MRISLTIGFLIWAQFARLQTVTSNTSVVISEWLAAHNQWRDEVGVPHLIWNNNLAKSAEKWALNLSKGYGHLYHSKCGNGENIYWTSEEVSVPIDATDAWGSEKEFYHNQKISGSNFKDFGHYTQMIWADTREVGCAIVSNGGNGTYVVCQYYPPGNYVGQHPYKK
jgi:pathogenesis-related protein 1